MNVWSKEDSVPLMKSLDDWTPSLDISDGKFSCEVLILDMGSGKEV